METGVSQVQTGETPRPSTPTAGALSAPQSSRCTAGKRLRRCSL